MLKMARFLCPNITVYRLPNRFLDLHYQEVHLAECHSIRDKKKVKSVDDFVHSKQAWEIASMEKYFCNSPFLRILIESIPKNDATLNTRTPALALHTT